MIFRLHCRIVLLPGISPVAIAWAASCTPGSVHLLYVVASLRESAEAYHWVEIALPSPWAADCPHMYEYRCAAGTLWP